MKRELALGVLVLLVGGSMAAFGTVYYSINDFVTPHRCSVGCNGTAIQPVVISYFLYPAWSPPSNSSEGSINALTKCAPQVESQTWYTPLNPAPSCLPPAVVSSANYTINIAGVVAMIFGAALVARAQLRIRDDDAGDKQGE